MTAWSLFLLSSWEIRSYPVMLPSHKRLTLKRCASKRWSSTRPTSARWTKITWLKWGRANPNMPLSSLTLRTSKNIESSWTCSRRMTALFHVCLSSSIASKWMNKENWSKSVGLRAWTVAGSLAPFWKVAKAKVKIFFRRANSVWPLVFRSRKIKPLLELVVFKLCLTIKAIWYKTSALWALLTVHLGPWAMLKKVLRQMERAVLVPAADHPMHLDKTLISRVASHSILWIHSRKLIRSEACQRTSLHQLISSFLQWLSLLI